MACRPSRSSTTGSAVTRRSATLVRQTTNPTTSLCVRLSKRVRQSGSGPVPGFDNQGDPLLTVGQAARPNGGLPYQAPTACPPGSPRGGSEDPARPEVRFVRTFGCLAPTMTSSDRWAPSRSRACSPSTARSKGIGPRRSPATTSQHQSRGDALSDPIPGATGLPGSATGPASTTRDSTIPA